MTWSLKSLCRLYQAIFLFPRWWPLSGHPWLPIEGPSESRYKGPLQSVFFGWSFKGFPLAIDSQLLMGTHQCVHVMYLFTCAQTYKNMSFRHHKSIKSRISCLLKYIINWNYIQSVLWVHKRIGKFALFARSGVALHIYIIMISETVMNLCNFFVKLLVGLTVQMLYFFFFSCCIFLKSWKIGLNEWLLPVGREDSVSLCLLFTGIILHLGSSCC